MKVNVENLGQLQRKLTISVPLNEFDKKVNTIVNKLKSKLVISGFRKGKVPDSVIKQKYNATINNDAANEMIKELLPQAFMQEKITPAGQPEVIKIDFNNNKEFIFVTNFEIYAEITIQDLTKLKVVKIVASVLKKDTDKTLASIQEHSASFNKVTRAVKTGDRVTINFTGLIDDKPFDGNKAENFTLIIGKKTMIPDFEKAIIGKKAQDEFSCNIVFPKDYNDKKLANKKAIFDIKIKQVDAVSYPKIDDNLAKKMGKKNVEELINSVKQHMQTNLTEKLGSINKNNVFDNLLTANDFMVPQSAVTMEAKNLLQNMQEQMKSQNTPQNDNITLDMFSKEAEKRVKLGLLLHKITSDNNIDASDEDIDDKIKQISKHYTKNSQEMIDYYKNNKDAVAGIKSSIIEQKAVDFIISKAQITEVKKSFNQVMTEYN